MLQMRCIVVTLLILLWAGHIMLQNPGNCPPSVALKANDCMEDRNCDRNMKCCATANGGKACVVPVTHQRYKIAKKAGKCPATESRWICGHACHNDGDCTGRKKCCQFGCGGHWCVNPM